MVCGRVIRLMNENSLPKKIRNDFQVPSEEILNFTDLLFEVAETLDFVLIPSPRRSLDDGE